MKTLLSIVVAATTVAALSCSPGKSDQAAGGDSTGAQAPAETTAKADQVNIVLWNEVSIKSTPEGVRRFAADNARAIAVIGGSALSPPELPLDKPLPVKPGAAYADVGFRLAFTAPSRSLAERLEWVLGDLRELVRQLSDGVRARLL